MTLVIKGKGPRLLALCDETSQADYIRLHCNYGHVHSCSWELQAPLGKICILYRSVPYTVGEPTMDKLDRLQRDEILEIVTENDWVALIIFE